jgi:hypothetical protein
MSLGVCCPFRELMLLVEQCKVVAVTDIRTHLQHTLCALMRVMWCFVMYPLKANHHLHLAGLLYDEACCVMLEGCLYYARGLSVLC